MIRSGHIDVDTAIALARIDSRSLSIKPYREFRENHFRFTFDHHGRRRGSDADHIPGRVSALSDALSNDAGDGGVKTPKTAPSRVCVKNPVQLPLPHGHGSVGVMSRDREGVGPRLSSTVSALSAGRFFF
jgi:hypothetical protein